ncbi:UDP-N-acetylmuramoyl-L-alanyl-D-glutamate--2,6-diaminopimelate ligase [Ferrimonas senticii]|uniref:UDP-N-acetylmuramoyl-L-alanyl-D-glutamate--2, 6-diaminopimelate ligase n=1 Tax=Ferrimonas senticii TaxID=394566 RepID=UPI000422F0D9|nr:UDP-N-acetylmuramoyl-L-alanyl-D-glutamate--2,6-diaminopimelate ligase [Ferrimonas senticii]
MSQLDELLSPWVELTTGVEISHAHLDSRQVQAGDLFVAVAGHQSDGRDYIEAAIAAGAVAVVTQVDSPQQQGLQARADGVPVVGIANLAERLSLLGLRCYPDAATPTLIGVTGTNGKTTVSQLCAQLLEALGQRAGVMGTVGNGLWGQLEASANTTSDPLTVARSLAAQAQAGATAVALEISSHGLAQGRVRQLPISTAVFTNLSRDHLDYHGDMDSYAAAKQRLFSQPGLQHAVLNLDDRYGALWHRQLQGQLHTIGYSLDGAECRGDYLQACEIEYHQHGVSATIRSSFGDGQLHSPLLGRFNLANVLAALAALLAEGYPLADLLLAAQSLQPACGRMELFAAAGHPSLVVDYAHTPDALEQALLALRRHCLGQLWCLFGCGGDRDRGKRPLMAAAAERHADKLVITADNPRSEAFEQIIADMQQGLSQPPALIEFDRALALTQAFAQAGGDDLILLAGKGHEDYQIVGNQTLIYNERALAAQLLAEAQS